MDDFPCICGHIKKDHNSVGCFKCAEIEVVEGQTVFKNFKGDVLHKYVPDNLKYLEQLYESRT